MGFSSTFFCFCVNSRKMAKDFFADSLILRKCWGMIDGKWWKVVRLSNIVEECGESLTKEVCGHVHGRIQPYD